MANFYTRALSHLFAAPWLAFRSGSEACQFWQLRTSCPCVTVPIMRPREHMAATVYTNLIDGSWSASSSGRLFENRNPADQDDLIGTFQESTPEDAERAIAAAERAYAGWRLVPAPRRAELLFRAAQLIAERKEQFARDMTREMGKVLEETRGDVQEAIDMTFFMAGEGRRLYGQTVPSELRDK
ncbi:MAG TPA: aldehyde dehydrogenase family protein, partial [Vicinamibacterales bacterium]